MKAVILNMTVDKRWWLQCCLKSDTHTHTGMLAQSHTYEKKKESQALSRKQYIVAGIKNTCFCFVTVLHTNVLERSRS